MDRVVLHIKGDEIPYSVFQGAFLTRGQQLSIHVDMSDGTVTVLDFYRESGRPRMRARTVQSITECGCP